ncbi:hypothetical protein OAM79_00265 [Litorivicinus sp.]|nr:hypothetical protein [Litorivicinus sp.]
MKFFRLIALVATIGVIAGCNTTAYVNVKSGDTSQKVRVVTIRDGTGEVLERRHELYDSKTMGWFEAAASATGSYVLTPAGKAAQARAEREAQGGGGDGGGGGGGC